MNPGRAAVPLYQRSILIFIPSKQREWKEERLPKKARLALEDRSAQTWSLSGGSLLISILGYLRLNERSKSAAGVCKLWAAACSSRAPVLWRQLVVRGR